MFSFSAAFFATLVAGAAASNPALATYEPQTNVADHSAGISLDQKAINTLVGVQAEGSFANAQDVYEQGGNSKSYAEIELKAPLGESLAKGTEMHYEDADGNKINGKAYKTYASTVTKIGFQYATGETYEAHVSCKVGGLPAGLQVKTGCIPEGEATIFIDGTLGNRDYSSSVNMNGRTIQGFSTGANLKFRPDRDPNEEFFSFFQPYSDYYGSQNPDFADKIITAAFDSTSAGLGNGNVDLTGYGFSARGEVAKKVSAFVAVGLYVLYETWDAQQDCANNCEVEGCNDDRVHALDEAVAFYVGSEQTIDPANRGNLFYGLAEKRASDFATSEESTKGQASSNKRIMLEFNDMKARLNAGECTAATKNAEKIKDLMQIPVIQGTMRYSFLQATQTSPTEKTMAEGMAFASYILPIVNACNAADAATIYNNVKLPESRVANVDFEAVKKAFEDNYDCMKLTCADIGGIIDSSVEDDYFEAAKPCGGASNLLSDATSGVGVKSLSLAVGVIAAFTTLLM